MLEIRFNQQFFSKIGVDDLSLRGACNADRRTSEVSVGGSHRRRGQRVYRVLQAGVLGDVASTSGHPAYPGKERHGCWADPRVCFVRQGDKLTDARAASIVLPLLVDRTSCLCLARPRLLSTHAYPRIDRRADGCVCACVCLICACVLRLVRLRVCSCSDASSFFSFSSRRPSACSMGAFRD